MRDERTKLLTFVLTWMDGVPSNVGKFWQKWRRELEQEGKKHREEGKNRGLRLGLEEALYIVISVVPVGYMNRD